VTADGTGRIVKGFWSVAWRLCGASHTTPIQKHDS